ncbi:MAG: hypothetical protein ABI863_05850 [Ginsengibacter sp.]
METIVILLFLAILIIIFAGLGLLIFYLYLKIRRKGYQPPFVTLITFLSFGIGITVALLILPSSNKNIFIFLDISIPCLLTGISMATFALILPKRNARQFGERKRKFPFAMVGTGIIAIGILIILFVLYSWKSFGWEFLKLIQMISAVLTLLLPLSLYFFYLETRKKVHSLRTVNDLNNKPPVLYLRAFNQESQYFAVGPVEEYGQYTKGLVARMSKAGQNVGVTFEEYLNAEISSIGPLVALGSPEDYLPPEGASRMYADDKNWMSVFKELSKRALCIIIEVGKSENLVWELKDIKANGFEQKLFVITRPTNKRQNYLTRKFLSILSKIRGIDPISWALFSEELGRIGYNLTLSDPGPGSVITFDNKGKSILLTTGSKMPSDFISPMRHWIFNRNKS